MDILKLKNKKGLHILFFIGFFLLLTFLKVLNLTEYTRGVVGFYANPVAYWAGSRANGFNKFMLDLKRLPDLQKKYNDLLLENSRLEAENARYLEIKDKFEGLQKSMPISEKKKSVLIGEVVLNSFGDNSVYLLVNLGHKDNVFKGDTVFWEDNFVGIVSSSQNSISRVNLPYHEESMFRVRVFKDDGEYAEGVVRGSSSGLRLENISSSFPLKEGQKVIVVDQKVEFHLVLGEVANVESDVTKASKSAMVTPFLNYRKLNYVFLVE